MLVNGRYCSLPKGSKTFGQAALSRHPSGNLTLSTGPNPNQVRVSKLASNNYAVTCDGQTFTFSKAELRKLTLDTGGGNDRVVIDASVDVPFRVRTGAGNDAVVNHARGVHISAGAGDDRVVSYASDCYISGGAGRDRLSAYGDRNRLTGNDGNDALFASGRRNYLVGGPGADVLRARGLDNATFSGLAPAVPQLNLPATLPAPGTLPAPALPQGVSSAALGAAGDTSDVSRIFADPSLTVEDKIALVLSAIMKNMDKDIEAQAQHIANLQNGTNGGAKNPSIDVEVSKLERLTTKRAQLFDSLKNILQKYDQTAKGIIDSIGR